MRKRRGFFDDEWMFPDFDEIERMFDDVMKGMARGRGMEGGKPLVYGFSMKVGPDGKPHFEQFGNVSVPQGKVKSEREPLVDIINNAREVIVIAELPGVEKSDVKLSVAEKDNLVISVTDPQRKYFKQVRLPAEVDEKSATAKLKNGMLEVTLKKLKPGAGEERGTAIKVTDE
ncbi:Hsp20/alpha crystallin family protein [Candidatus Micrarchaeota archaeon]|nr:Hsp20/alpha crystallin family protein [Candidatus Micrarchaeota archaeon]MBI5177294.1 Hsp20/alpha crystallin family protein [Candidatus Micrarchaeota archaeon]